MNFRDLPVRRKLMIIILLVSGIVAGVTCGTLFVYDYVTFRQVNRQVLATLGEVVANNSTAALAFQNRDDAGQVLAALKAEPHIMGAAIYTPEGRLFAKFPAARSDDSFPRQLAADGYRFIPSLLVGYQPIVMDGQRLGTLYLESDMAAMAERRRVYEGMVALLALGSFLLAFLLSSVLQRSISRPIVALTETVQAVSRGNYSLRAARLGGGELGLLTDGFNQMLGEIQKLNQELEQRVLQRTAQLEMANQELEAFSYSVSHDLRAPLRHIDGYAQLLQQRSGAALDVTGQRYLTTITESAKRLGTLIDELLVFSRMGRTELRHDRNEVRPLIDEVLRELQPDLQDRRVEWAIADLPSVQADAAMLRQVWTNLLSNAVKYTRGQEPARIEIAHRRDEGGHGDVFSVRDNGAGFDMKYVDKLFGVFQRLHNATEFEGTGIGLANVRRIVQRHGGRVWAEGKVGEGATFYFALPDSAPAP